MGGLKSLSYGKKYTEPGRRGWPFLFGPGSIWNELLETEADSTIGKITNRGGNYP